MKTMLSLAVAASLAAPVVALGHGSGVHARGTIKEITPDHVVLTGNGADQVIAMGKDTAIVRGDRSVRIQDVRVGERAVVHARREGKALSATEIRLAPTDGAPSRGKTP